MKYIRAVGRLPSDQILSEFAKFCHSIDSYLTLKILGMIVPFLVSLLFVQSNVPMGNLRTIFGWQVTVAKKRKGEP